MMDDAEEEALFARLRRGLDLVRRDAVSAQSDPAAPVAASDPEMTAAVARVEASLRTLASNLESLARRTDGLDAGIETRVETTVGRVTAGLRAELERLSSRVTALTAPPAMARPDPVRPNVERPLGSAGRHGGPAPTRGRRRRGRALLAAFVVLALTALGLAAATRLGYGLDAYPVGRELQARWQAQWEAWRTLWFPGASDLSSRNVTVPTPALAQQVPPAPPPAPSKVADAPPPQPSPASPATAAPPPSTEPVAAPAATPAPTVAPVANSSPPVAPQPPPLPPRPPVTMLRAKAPVWVEVRDRTGHVLLRRTLQEGDSWAVPADPDLFISAGNARGLELTVDGEPRALPPSKGNVLHDAPLNGT
ncbi:MAG: RodZ domain-containing protein [Acetobacteraceae bacterium]